MPSLFAEGLPSGGGCKMNRNCIVSRFREGDREEQVLSLPFGRAASGVAFLLLTTLWVQPGLSSHEPVGEEGWRLVKERCLLCHYISQPEAKFAPSLQDLFKRQSLRNGKPVNDQTVSEWIAEGSANMPAFKYTLTPPEIQAIVSFLKKTPPPER